MPVPPAALPAAATAVCGRLAAALPATVGDGLRRRAVTGDATRTAAWGEPPVTLLCGAPAPAADAEQVQLGPPGGGVTTFAVTTGTGTTAFTTVGLPVAVRVSVPDAYDSTLLVPLTGAVQAAETG